MQPQKITHNIKIRNKMTKADIVAKISEKLGLEKGDVQATVEAFMEEVKNSLTFAIKGRAFISWACVKVLIS